LSGHSQLTLDVGWERDPRGNQFVNKVLFPVLIGLVDNILALVVIPGQIWLTFFQKIVNAVLVSRSYRVEDRRLPIVVHMVRVPTFFDQHLHDISVTLSGGIENRRLAITVDMVGLATMLKE